MGTEGSPEVAARLREAMGLNRAIPVQYADWLWRALRGDLGVSIQYDVPVARLIVSRLPVTLPLTLLAACLMSVTALPLGLYAATRHRRAGDYVAMVFSQIGIAIPSFWAGLLLILLFSVRLGWVQSGGFEGWSGGLWPRIRSPRHLAVALGAAGPTVPVLLAAPRVGYTPSDALAVELARRVLGPSAAHPFGRDQYGRAVLSRIMRGAVASIAVGVIAVRVGAAA